MQFLSSSQSRCPQACEHFQIHLFAYPASSFSLEMSDPWSLSITTSERTHGRPSHLSVGSLVTNASGLAESTISQWTAESADTAARISQFPVPPTELPTPTTPTRSTFPSPRSAATSLRKSLSTVSSHLPSPVSPSSQIDPAYRFSPVPSRSSSVSMASAATSVGQASAYDAKQPLSSCTRGRPMLRTRRQVPPSVLTKGSPTFCLSLHDPRGTLRPYYAEASSIPFDTGRVVNV